MTLPYQDVEIPFLRGLSGKEGQKYTQGALLLENACFDELGVLNKRNAYTASALSGAKNILSHGKFSSLYVSGAAPSRMPYLTSYNALRSTFSSYGNFLNCRVSVDKSVLGTPPAAADLRTLDCMLGTGDKIYYAYQNYIAATTYDTTKIVTKDTITGQTLESVTVPGDFTSGRFVKIGTWGYIFACRAFAVGTPGEIRYLGKPAARTYWETSTTAMTTGTAEVPWDICYWKDDQFATVWLDAAHHVNITTWDMSSDTQVSTVDTAIEAAVGSCLAIWSDEHATTPRLTVMYEAVASHDFSVMVYDKDLTQTVAPVTVFALGATNFARRCSMSLKPDNNATTISYALSYDGAITPAHTVIGEFDYNAGALVSTQDTIFYSRLGSRLITLGKETYFWVTSEVDYAGYGTNHQPGAYLVTRSLGYGSSRATYTVAHALYGDAHELTLDANDLGKLSNLSYESLGVATNFKLYWVCPYSTDSSPTAQKLAAGVQVTINPFLQNVAIDGNNLLSGGFLHALGKKTVHANGFLQYPKIDSLTGGNPGGSMSDGVYSVVVVFEYSDEDGQLHRSAASDPESITLSAGGAAQTITVAVRTCKIGSPTKYTNCRYVAYRTTAGGSIYYYSGAYAIPGSSITSATISITVTAADATIDDYQTLYTTGGVLESIAPPAPLCLTAGEDRVFLLSAEDPHEVWFSKPKEEGIASEFNEACVIRYPEPQKMIRWFNGSLYSSTGDKIYCVIGDGPNALGQGGQFSLPRLSSNLTGCENPYSVIETPQGLMFQSQMPMDPLPATTPSATASESAGLWLLNGSGVQPVLAPDDFSFYPITSAVAVPKKNQILFTLWGYTNSNALLAYDYVSNQWSTHLINETGTQYPFGACVNSAHQMANGAYWYTQATTFGSADVMKIRTPWIKPGQLISGYGRVKWVYLMGTWKSSHTLNIKVYYDYDDSTAVETITASITSTTTPYLYRFKPARQRCNAIMIEIYDSDLAGTYESFSLDGLMLRLAKKAHQVLPAAKTL